MTEPRTFDDFLNLPIDEQRRVFEKTQAEALKKRKYGLYWDDSRHQEDVVRRCEHEMPVLEEDEARRLNFTPPAADLFDTPDRPQPTHLLIEGDNYHALSVLNYTHRGKIDLIYIDPPYNTGNKDFRYNDHFVDKEDGDRHTKWLSFMHRRLELAKHLLKDTGVIFISIDDNEVAQLKLLCDRVFGEGNFVVNFAWEKRYAAPPDTKDIGYTHESILLFRKTSNFQRHLLQKTEEQIARYKNPDNDFRGEWKAADYTCRYTKNERPNLYYPVNQPNTGEIIYPKQTRVWAFSKSEHEKNVFENKIWWGANGKNSVPALKNFLEKTTQGSIPVSLLKHTEVGHTDEAQKELRQLVENIKFTPKPKRLINHLIKIGVGLSENPIILDFFAGSGTTGHAVLEMNKTDGGRRQFILVTNNEVTDRTRRQLEKEGKTAAEIEEIGICRAVTYPRLQKVLEGYTNPKGEKVAGTGGKLRYFQTDFVAVSDNSVQAAYNLRDKCAEMICVRENVFQNQEKSAAFEIYQDFDRVLALLYDDAPEHCAVLKKRLAASDARERILYVFTLGTEISPALVAEFEGIRLESIPARIIDLYKRHLREAARKQPTAYETYDEETTEPNIVSPPITTI